MIFITGCARSGTSLTTQILERLGCYLGPKTHINGLFENTLIRENVIKNHLRDINCDPLGQIVLPDRDEVRDIPDLRRRVMGYMGYPEEPWAYKGAKICLLWRPWHRVFPEAKWVVVRRDRKKIAESCMRTKFMRAYSDINSWLGWVDAHEHRFHDMREAGLDMMEVWPDEYTKEPEKLAELCQWLDLKYDEAALKCFQSKKWHEAA